MFFVTSNPKKVREVEKILGFKIKHANIEIKEIQSLDVCEVCREKVIKAYEILKKPVFVEDTGLYIDSLGGLPGALVKWFLKTIGNDGICRIVRGNRTATAKTCVCFFDGHNLKCFLGELKGKISDRPRGKLFGWDSIFIPNCYDKTLVELGLEEKNKISMRRKAFLKFKEFLSSTARI